MEDCPQCHNPIKSPHARLVIEDCGHKKCRLCLIKDEDGCRQCAVTNNPNALQKEPGGKKMPFHPTNITKRGRKKKLPYVSEKNNNESLKTEDNNITVYNRLCEKRIKKEAFEKVKTECETDESSDRQCDDSASNNEMEDETREPKDETSDVNGFVEKDMKVESIDVEETEVKVDRKRKPMCIADHISIAPGNPTTYTCTVCVKTFKRREHVRYHNFCASGDKPYKCEQCAQGFVSKAHYECHLLVHTGVRPFQCEVCGSAFKQKDKLSRHIKIHTGEKPFGCQTCGKRFIASHALKAHQLIHTGEKPYLCPQCGRGFNDPVNLRKHIMTHSGEKIYMCEDCGKSFSSKWSLINHQRTHSRERPYRCPTCSRHFTNKKELRRHSDVHSDKRPFQCSICDTSFRRKDNRERHMKNSHPETRMFVPDLMDKPSSLRQQKQQLEQEQQEQQLQHQQQLEQQQQEQKQQQQLEKERQLQQELQLQQQMEQERQLQQEKQLQQQLEKQQQLQQQWQQQQLEKERQLQQEQQLQQQIEQEEQLQQEKQLQQQLEKVQQEQQLWQQQQLEKQQQLQQEQHLQLEEQQQPKQINLVHGKQTVTLDSLECNSSVSTKLIPQNTSSKKVRRRKQPKKSTCIKSTSKAKKSESVKPYVELTVPPSILKRVREEKNLQELPEEPEPMVKPTSNYKEIMNSVKNFNVAEVNIPFQGSNITGYTETLTPADNVTITRIMNPVQDMNVTRADNVTITRVMNPVQDMNVSNYNSIRDTSIISFKEMLDPVHSTNVFSGGTLFEQIPEATQVKSQAVPVINSPIAPSNYSVIYEEPLRTNDISNYSNITYDRDIRASNAPSDYSMITYDTNINTTSIPSSYPIINYGGPPRYKEKIIIEGTNCVPTITKASNVFQPSVVRSNSTQQNIVTNVNTSNQRYFSCKKTGKILETDNLGSYIPTTTKLLQSDLHWRKRTIELSQLQQEMAQNNDFV